MLVPLISAVAGECGGKAGALGALLRAGVPLPDGFVVPFAAHRAAVRELKGDPDAARRAIESRPLDAAVVKELARALDELGDPPVAVRSSASDEDTGQVSAAGQYESFLAVRGAADVADAVRACWASLLAPHALAYRDASGHGRPSGEFAMAVIVQRQVDADVSGVMFTPTGPDDGTRIEASWGLGPSVVGGTVTPDAYRVAGDGSVEQTIAPKRTRLDRHGGRLVTRDVPVPDRDRPTLDTATAVRLAELGREIAAVRGGPQDVEWAIADGHVWILQARPITAVLPSRMPGELQAAPTGTPGSHATDTAPITRDPGEAQAPPIGTPSNRGTTIDTAMITRDPGEVQATLTGTPGSRGTVTGTARVVRGPGDFGRVRPGDILVCPFTDPAWTPLLRVAAGVVTEVGGVLSHAAIVAREHGIPAVLGVAEVTSRLHDGAAATIDGTTGTITIIREEEGGGAAPPPRPNRS
ncbi:pyruvate, phosphate dikinase [Spongiactinospora gelatinilytica]|uniref:Pyruvate, phosphate dikinase n=1 Tax=Spongiactinospora gelatinilytica TaxID=2666298 RepID=A0A2W2H6P6_9ACTN|nr:PEP/pyruvate-binding domain-containing protein [Spongiactinospora gelatinilytica]PZG45700.1 pyruvate, phosphate dikinase [Spongiactinospora gelatinilytica]